MSQRWKTDRSDDLKIRPRIRVERKVYRRCTRIIDTFECRVTRFRPNTVWRRRLTVVNALTTTANISIGSTIKSISWLPTKIPRYAFIPEIGKQRGIFSIRNRNHGDHFCNLKAKLSYRVGLKNRWEFEY